MFTQKQPIDEIDKITSLEKKYVKLESEFLELNNRLKKALVNLMPFLITIYAFL